MTRQQALNQIASLDPLIINPARLMIVYLLDRQGKMDYLALMSQTGLSSGNITTHLGKLARKGYIKIKKSFRGNKPHTAIELSDAGNTAYRQWAQQILVALPQQLQKELRTGLQLGELSQVFYTLGRKDWGAQHGTTDRWASIALRHLERVSWPPKEEIWN